MNLKKRVVGLAGILIVMSLTACSDKPKTSEGAAQNVQTVQETAGVWKEEISEGAAQNVQTTQKTAGSEKETGTLADDLPKQQGERNQSETTTIESQNQDEAIELYADVLRNYISSGKTDFAVSFIDLDDDSTKEMVVFFGESQEDGGYLFTIKNGQAIRVVAEGSDFFGQYGGFTYKEKGNVFVSENESVTDNQISNQISYYTMEKGKAVCKDVTESITQFDNDESRFYVNGTEVESKKFDSIAENYGLSEMLTVSYSDGIRVMGEQQMDMVYNAYNDK